MENTIYTHERSTFIIREVDKNAHTQRKRYGQKDKQRNGWIKIKRSKNRNMNGKIRLVYKCTQQI